jgi:hypothetical protein
MDFVAVVDQGIALLHPGGRSRTQQPADGQDRRLPTLHHGRREAS